MPMKKFIGKPYAGKPHVRIDEGVGRVFSILPALLYWSLSVVEVWVSKPVSQKM